MLYYIAENLAARARRVRRPAGRADRRDRGRPQREVELAIERLFTYAAWADKYDGPVHHTPFRNVTLAMPEPIGVLGIVCPDDWPLLGFLSTVLPAIAMGNTVVAVPSERWPLRGHRPLPGASTPRTCRPA